MRQDSYQRKLDKKTNNTIRDSEGGIGNARGAVKANRALGKAIIEAALDDVSEEDNQQFDECIMCGKGCLSSTCSVGCHNEAVKLGLIKL